MRFIEGRNATSGNYSSRNKNLYLFNNLIATYDSNGIIITPAGYSSTTTSKALGCLIRLRAGRVSGIKLGNRPTITRKFEYGYTEIIPINTTDLINIDNGMINCDRYGDKQ